MQLWLESLRPEPRWDQHCVLCYLFSLVCSWNVRGLGSPDTAVNDKTQSERLLKRELLAYWVMIAKDTEWTLWDYKKLRALIRRILYFTTTTDC